MASEAQANIILRLKDEFSKNLQSAGKNFDSFARSVDQMGTAISRTGMKMVAIGTTMNAPFFAAAKAMEKYSFAASNEMQRLNTEILSLSKVISEAAMPSIRAFNDNFSKIINTIKTLDPVMLENIARWSMTAGQILLVVGTVEIFVGKTISLMGKMASGWLGKINLIIGAIALLTYAWTQHHDAFMKVLNSIDYAFNWWVEKFLLAHKQFLEALLTLSKVFPPMAGMTGPLQAGINGLAYAVKGFQTNMQQAVAGNGAFAQSVNNMSKNIFSGINSFNAAMDSASTKLATVMADMKLRVQDTANTLADGFGDAFDKVMFEGQSFASSMKSLFSALGRSILKDFISTVGRNMLGSILGATGTQSGSGLGGLAGAGLGSFFGPIGTAIGGFLGGALKFHEGGMIYAHNGLAPDEVPIIAQSGEGVLSRRGMSAIGGSDSLRKLNSGRSGTGGQTVNYAPIMVIQAWDASDVYRNRKVLTAAIEQDIMSNGSLRRAIKGC